MDEYTVNKEELEFLRNNTTLNPIDSAKVIIARRRADKIRDDYIKFNPTNIIEVDYSIADELEYQLRKNAWMKSCEKSWKEYIRIENDGYGLIEFAEDQLKRKIKEQIERTK